MSRAGSVHKDTSGLWSFVVDTAPLGAPRRRVIVEIAEWLDKQLRRPGKGSPKLAEAWLSQAIQGKAGRLASRSCGTGIEERTTR